MIGPKEGTVVNKLPAYEDWKAPWESDGGEFNAEVAKKLIYNLTSDRSERDLTISSLRAEARDTKKQLDELQTSGLSDLEKAQKELEALRAAPPEDEATKLENLRLRVALDKGLSGKQLRYLSGATEEELNTNADDILSDFGGGEKQPTARERQSGAPKRDLRTGAESPGAKDAIEGSTPAAAAEFLPKTGW